MGEASLGAESWPTDLRRHLLLDVQTVPDMLGGIISVLAAGFAIGALGRLAVPGPDPMPFWLTVFIGMGGSVVGGSIASVIYGGPSNTFDTANHAFVTLMLEVVIAIGIVAGYRRYVQKRPLSGPGAHRFPARGFGIPQMRERLRRAGVDPDKLTTRPDLAAPEPDAEGRANPRADRGGARAAARGAGGRLDQRGGVRARAGEVAALLIARETGCPARHPVAAAGSLRPRPIGSADERDASRQSA